MSDDPAAPYLEIAGLWHAFGASAVLRGIDLQVRGGEFVCILGPSGCGKTTLLRAIAGLEQPSRGTIRQGGRDVSGLPASRRDCGIVFQSYALFPNLTAARNIAFGLENTGRAKSAIRARVAELLSLVGLGDHAGKYPAQLSGGQQQRVALARAIAIDPGLLLLDEPLSALDARVRVHLRHEIRDLQRKLGITTIMVTHDREEALSMADRIVVMSEGLIRQAGTPAEVYRHPASLFVAGVIGDTNRIDGVIAGGRVRLGDGALTVAADRRGLPEGARVSVTIRPEDILAHPAGDTCKNLLAVSVAGMEFLGSSWRVRLRSGAPGVGDLEASLPVDAVERLALAPGAALHIGLPADRLLVFAREDGA